MAVVALGHRAISAGEAGEMLAGMAAQTTGVLAANFVTEEIDREAVEAAAARVRIVDFFWADPDPGLVGRRAKPCYDTRGMI